MNLHFADFYLRRFFCRMNWNNGDFYWAKQTYNARYWPKNSQLGAVSSTDASIKQYPEKLKEVLERLELLDEAAVVFAGFGTTTQAWNQVFESQRCMAKELQEQYPDAMDEQKKVIYRVKYAEHRIIGFDDDLYKFSAALAVATPASRNETLSPQKISPQKRFRK